MSGEQPDIDTIITNKTINAVTNLFSSKTPEQNKIILSIMGEIGSTLSMSSQQRDPILLDSAVAVPSKFEDGSAIFLFNDYKEYVHHGIVFISVKTQMSDDNIDDITVNNVQTNNSNLSQSRIAIFYPEQKKEIIRQLRTLTQGPGDFVLSMFFLQKPPEDYKFFEAVINDPHPITDEYTGLTVTEISEAQPRIDDEVIVMDNVINSTRTIQNEPPPEVPPEVPTEVTWPSVN